MITVASDDSGPVGFVAGVTNTGAFYKHFIKRHGVRAALAAGYRLMRPSVIRRALETLRYEGGIEDVPAELLSTSVAATARRSGLATELGTRFLAGLRDRGVMAATVAVASSNSGAIGLYEKLGFERAIKIEVHAGTESEVLVWRA